MSLYQMLMGNNPFSDELRMTLYLDSAPQSVGRSFSTIQELYNTAGRLGQEDLDNLVISLKTAHCYPTGRYRDIVINAQGTRIELLTRNNEGSGKSWCNSILRSHPCYLRDLPVVMGEDDYVCMEFKVPQTIDDFKFIMDQLTDAPDSYFNDGIKDIGREKWVRIVLSKMQERLKEIAELSDNTSPTIKFSNFLQKMTDKKSPEYEQSMKVGAKIAKAIMNDKETNISDDNGGIYVGRIDIDRLN